MLPRNPTRRPLLVVVLAPVLVALAVTVVAVAPAGATKQAFAHDPACLGGGVRRERRDRLAEDPRPEQPDLAAAALLGRGTDELDRRPEPGGLLRDLEERPDGGHRDEVVAAGVPHGRQGVVLRQQRDRGAQGGPDAGAERGGDAADPALDRMTVSLHERRDALHRAVLLERQLGIAVDLARQRDELACEVGLHRAAAGGGAARSTSSA